MSRCLPMQGHSRAAAIGRLELSDAGVPREGDRRTGETFRRSAPAVHAPDAARYVSVCLRTALGGRNEVPAIKVMTAAASCMPGGNVAAAAVRHDFPGTGPSSLIVEVGAQMVAHRPGMALAKAVIQPLVVRVIEPLLLQGPFEIPVDLRHEQEAGRFSELALSLSARTGPLGGPRSVRRHRAGRAWPCRSAHRRIDRRSSAILHHRVLRGGIAVVQLQCIRPAGKIGITPIGKQHVTALALDPGIILRRLAKSCSVPRIK